MLVVSHTDDAAQRLAVTKSLNLLLERACIFSMSHQQLDRLFAQRDGGRVVAEIPMNLNEVRQIHHLTFNIAEVAAQAECSLPGLDGSGCLARMEIQLSPAALQVGFIQ